MPTDLSWLAQLRDIHPAPPLDEGRLTALSLLLVLLALLPLLIRVRQWRRRRAWLRHWQAAPWPERHAALRHLTASRWPDLAIQPTPVWLAALETRCGARLSGWAPEWDRWIYGALPVPPAATAAIEAALPRLLAACPAPLRWQP